MRRRHLATALALLACLAPHAASAHEVRPGYLELREVDARSYDLLWKVPARADLRLGLYVQLPETCRSTEPVARLAGGAHVERWRSTCEDGLVGRTIRIAGLEATRTDVLARLERADGTTQTARLTPENPAFQVTATTSQLEVARTYLVLGVEHILLGLDHLLFVLALLFLVRGWRRLVGTLTAFTAAHSLTLAAASLGWVRVPQAPVEAAIALSIVFVATEILHAARGRAGLAARKPWSVAFAFGLLHGLGFAGALRDLGLPEHAIPLALALFNVGVEVGQLAFVCAVFLLLATLRAALMRFDRRAATDPWAIVALAARPAAYGIGTLAAFWLIERTSAFWRV